MDKANKFYSLEAFLGLLRVIPLKKSKVNFRDEHLILFRLMDPCF